MLPTDASSATVGGHRFRRAGALFDQAQGAPSRFGKHAVMRDQPTLYDTLQVSPGASPLVIRAAYRSLSQCQHPDKLTGSSAAQQLQAELNLAYTVLSDPGKRQCYDQTMALAAYAVERRGLGATPTAGRVTGQSMVTHTMRPFAFRPLF
jgi:DnaJ-class molecular chaperone